MFKTTALMKRFTIVIGMLVSVSCFSQLKNEMFIKQPEKARMCATKEESAEFDRETARLVANYKQLHPDYIKPKSAANRDIQRTLFAWPIRATSDYDIAYNIFNLENYVDQDPDQGGSGDDDDRDDNLIEDYQCNNRTYDNHRGQDINLYPFWWRMMDRNYVMAVAAAPGVILSKDNGNFDKNCECQNSPNRVRVLHEDGSVSSYWHLKNNTLTSKGPDEAVEAGEFLGFVGSSGCSSWPHLHFEVRDEFNGVIEPFHGPCNVKNNSTWWQNQRPYWDPQINRLMTHSNIPILARCSDDEAVYAKNQFSAGDILYTGIAFMDGQSGDQASCSLLRPNGTTYDSWTVTLGSTDSRDYKVNGFVVPSAAAGTWTFRVVYRSRTYVHYFTVGCTANETVSGTIGGNDGHIVGTSLTSTAVHTGASNTRILYQSANEIELKPGFQADASSGLNFKARIKACTYTD
jgi:murein DD-endopeptidase MepM/ murein hydrolase activator NlpD